MAVGGVQGANGRYGKDSIPAVQVVSLLCGRRRRLQLGVDTAPNQLDGSTTGSGVGHCVKPEFMDGNGNDSGGITDLL